MRPSPFPCLSLALPCWLSFRDWLDACVAGQLPVLACSSLQPAGVLLPAAQVMARLLGPWMQAQLATRSSQPPQPAEAARQQRQQLKADVQAHLLLMSEVRLERAWVQGRLQSELARLTRLVEALTEDFSRRGWLEWEVRYWALVVCLTRLGQLAAALERCPASAARS